MIDILIQTKDIVKVFSEAVKEKDLELIYSLLSSDGVFEIQQEDLKTVERDKTTFIDWFSNKLSSVTIESVTYDRCLYCKIGNPVVLFNDGQFPVTPKDLFDSSMTGLMLDIRDDKITCIMLCLHFANTDNKCVFESNCWKVKDYVNNGWSIEDAYKLVFNTDTLD